MASGARVHRSTLCDLCGEPLSRQEIGTHKIVFHQALQRELLLAGRKAAKISLSIYGGLGSLFLYGIVVLNWPTQPWWRPLFVTFLAAMITVLVVGAVLGEYFKGQVMDGTEWRCPVCDLRRLRPEIRLHLKSSHPDLARGLRRLVSASWIALAVVLGLVYFLLGSLLLDGLSELVFQWSFVALPVSGLVFVIGALLWANRKFTADVLRARESWKLRET